MLFHIDILYYADVQWDTQGCAHVETELLFIYYYIDLKSRLSYVVKMIIVAVSRLI